MSGEQAPLFEVPAEAVRRQGRAEAALRRALLAGRDDGTIRDVDEALAESALILARVMDTADAIGGLKGGYLAAQAGPAFQRKLHALRLPTELTAAAAPLPATDDDSLSDWLRDLGDALGPS